MGLDGKAKGGLDALYGMVRDKETVKCDNQCTNAAVTHCIAYACRSNSTIDPCMLPNEAWTGGQAGRVLRGVAVNVHNPMHGRPVIRQLHAYVVQLIQGSVRASCIKLLRILLHTHACLMHA